MQCGKICRHGHCEVIVSLTSHEQKKAISPTGAVEQMRQFRRPPDQCSLYGAWKASRCDLKGPKFQIFSRASRGWAPICIDILACHDETIHAITVIRLNLNPPFKNSRSATGIHSELLSLVSVAPRLYECSYTYSIQGEYEVASSPGSEHSRPLYAHDLWSYYNSPCSRARLPLCVTCCLPPDFLLLSLCYKGCSL